MENETIIQPTAAAPEPAPAAEPALPERKHLSSGRLVAKRFFRSKLSIVGLSTLIFLFAFSFIGPLFVGWGEVEDDQQPSAPQYTQVRETYTDAEGNEVYTYIVTVTQHEKNFYAPPSGRHWLGTDGSAYDILARLMYGGRVSLLLGFLVIFSEAFIGVILGGVAGYYGKWVDQLIMRLVEIFSCIPTLPLLLIISFVLTESNVDPSIRIYFLLMFMVIFGWTGFARVVRGQVLVLREQEYMVAAEAMGFSAGRRIFKHLLPNVMPQIIVQMTLGLGGVILYESTLSYLNLGVPVPYASWGQMVSAASNPVILNGYFNMWGPPGFLIVMAVLAFNFVGDGLRDALDPRMRR